MKIYAMYFSPTGGTKRVLDVFAEEWQINGWINLTKDEAMPGINFTAEDICIVAVPSFGGRVPEVALNRMRRWQGNGATAVLAVTYGNRAYDDTLLELKEELISSGFVPKAAVAAVTEHSIVREFGAGRPDVQDKEVLRGFVKEIQKFLENGKIADKLIVPGNYPYREHSKSLMIPKATADCTGCGSCAVRCPVGAINPTNPNQVDEEKCISCMCCVLVCPWDGRKLPDEMLAGVKAKIGEACALRKENELFLAR